MKIFHLLTTLIVIVGCAIAAYFYGLHRGTRRVKKFLGSLSVRKPA